MSMWPTISRKRGRVAQKDLRCGSVARLLLKVPHDHSTSFLESKSLVESLDLLVTDQVNHVEIFELSNHASDQL